MLWGADSGAPQLTQRGAELLQAGKAEQAIGLLNQAVAAAPAYYPAHSLLGVAYTQLGKPDKARPFFEKAVQLAPKSAQARNNLGANYLALNRPQEAVGQFQQVLAADSANVSAWINLANAYSQLRNAGKAVEALERAHKLSPQDPEVRVALAEARIRSGQDWKELLRADDPGTAAILLNRAAKQMDEEAYETALALLAAVEGTQRGSARWNEMIGYCEFRLGRAEPALKHLQEVIRLEPANEDAYLTLAEFLGTNNAVDPIVAVFESAVKVLPHSVKIRSGLGVAYWMQRDFEKAESVLSELVKEFPGDELGYKLLADCYNRAQAWDKLRSVAAEMRKRNPRMALGWYYAALAEHRLMGPEGREVSMSSIREYTRTATRLDPNNWRCQVLLGKLLLEEKKTVEALAAFRKAVSLNAEEPSSHYLLATTLRQAGRAEESKRAFEGYRRAQQLERTREFRSLRVEIGPPQGRY